jgi:hypothetical protein
MPPVPVPDTSSVTTLLSYIGPFCAAAGLVLGVWYRVDGKIEAAKTAADKATAAAGEKAAAVERELSEFKVKVAEEYASWDTVRSIETRLTERMDELSDIVMKMPDAVLDRITKYLAIKPT